MLPPQGFGREYLQARIDNEFALARHMGIVVESVDAGAFVLSAPLAANANHQGTAFGGSLFSVAVLTGWAWLTRHLALRQISADAVIQESNMRYLSPVQGILRAKLVDPEHGQIEKFGKMLQRAGRGRIRLPVDIFHGDVLAARFDGLYAAAIRHTSRSTRCLES